MAIFSNTVVSVIIMLRTILPFLIVDKQVTFRAIIIYHIENVYTGRKIEAEFSDC